jgi:Mitochondrial pyruvate carriers
MLSTRFVHTIGRCYHRIGANATLGKPVGRTTASSGGRTAIVIRRSTKTKTHTMTTTIRQQSTESSASTGPTAAKKPFWLMAEFWGGLGALAGWGMSGSAIYDSLNTGPEVISLSMTPVLIVYSSLFARWAWVVKPQNLLLCGCHITNICAQGNQLRRALEYKISIGQEAEVMEIGQKTAIGGAIIGSSIVAGPTIRSYLMNANLGIISTVSGADAGPFTVHFWGPLSKWLISGASIMDLNRPTDKISIAQYTALTLTGFFFTPYSLLVTPINYMLFAVNAAMFTSSAWHLGRKINADYIQKKE